VLETTLNANTPAANSIEASIAQPPRRKLILYAANIGVAILFLIELAPGATRYGTNIANPLWMAGAIPMVFLSLVRIPPHTSRADAPSIIATTMMVLLAILMAPQSASTGLLASFGKAIELLAVIFSQLARIYLGRRFGLLPANRGIVQRGPFRIVRHPIYLGWLVLSIGFLMVYPTMRNAIVLCLTIPFMVWRIVLEEQLLNQDPAYREYCNSTYYRLLPWLF
jgi:protein-S-isoprenylcysteine O-methyltransferase Ste14